MRQRITTSLQSLIADRAILLVLALFMLICVGILIYLAFNIEPSELQVVVHYTSFGNTNFYRDKWYYLLSFVVFIVIMAIVHVALTYRILIQKGHDAAIAFAWLGVIIAVITGAMVYQILRIASLT